MQPKAGGGSCMGTGLHKWYVDIILYNYTLSIMKQQLYQSSLQSYTHARMLMSLMSTQVVQWKHWKRKTHFFLLLSSTFPLGHWQRGTLLCTDGVRVGAGGRASWATAIKLLAFNWTSWNVCMEKRNIMYAVHSLLYLEQSVCIYECSLKQRKGKNFNLFLCTWNYSPPIS